MIICLVKDPIPDYIVMKGNNRVVNLYLVLQKIIPGFPTQNVANAELKDIERNVSYDTIKPDNTSPPPTTSFDLCKVPISIHSY